MADQFDLFGAVAAPEPAPPPATPTTAAGAWVRESLVRANAHLYDPPPPHPYADVSPESLAAMAGVELLREVPDEHPGIGTSWPLVAVGRAGWDAAMTRREELTRRQITGTITKGDLEALAALRHLLLHHRPWLDTPAEAVFSACSYDHLQQALAGLRCAKEKPAE